jgi:hypothetical protein
VEHQSVDHCKAAKTTGIMCWVHELRIQGIIGLLPWDLEVEISFRNQDWGAKVCVRDEYFQNTTVRKTSSIKSLRSLRRFLSSTGH